MTNPTARPTIFIALDLELEQPSGEILSVGVAASAASSVSSVISARNFYITPSQPVSEYIQNLTGLKDSDFDFNKSRAECFQEVREWLDEQFQRAQSLNARIHREFVVWGSGDVTRLSDEFVYNTKKMSVRRGLDVKAIACYKYFEQRGRMPSGSLGLLSALSVWDIPEYGVAHNSEADAINTLKLFGHFVDSSTKLRQNITALSQFFTA